jgi:hypothetical protein
MRGDECRKIGFSLRVLRQAQQDTSARQAADACQVEVLT